MSIPLLHTFASGVLALAVTAGASGSESKSHPCAAVIQAAERLTCYDAAFPPASGALSGLIDVEAERAKALQQFGLSKMQVTEREPEAVRNLTPHRIEARVVRMGNRATGERVVTLDNDQTWLLTESTSRGWLRAGDRVVIRKAALGTFMLITPGRVPLRARRIQ